MLYHIRGIGMHLSGVICETLHPVMHAISLAHIPLASEAPMTRHDGELAAGPMTELAGNSVSAFRQSGSGHLTRTWFVPWAWRTGVTRGVEAIGVDEIHWGPGVWADNFLTVIYQIDADAGACCG